jgi:hypothetical protein
MYQEASVRLLSRVVAIATGTRQIPRATLNPPGTMLCQVPGFIETSSWCIFDELMEMIHVPWVPRQTS